MANKKLFSWGVALLLIHFLHKMCLWLWFVPASSHIFILNWFSPISEFVLFNNHVIMCVRLCAVLGLLLLVKHHHNADDDEKKHYRLLDRCLALVLLLSITFLMVPLELFSLLFSMDAFPLYIGFLRFIVIGRYVLFLAMVLLWVHGLWRAHAGKALLASLGSMALIFMPMIPYNNPEFLVQWDFQAQIQQEYNDENKIMNREPGDRIGQMDTPYLPEELNSTNLDTSRDMSAPVETSAHTVVKVHNYGDLTPLLLLAYTWMRWGNHAYKRNEEVASEATSNPETSTCR